MVERSLPGLENVSDRKALTTVALVQKHVVPLPTGLVSKSEITYRQRPFQIYALAGIIAALEKLLFLPLFSAFLFKIVIRIIITFRYDPHVSLVERV